MYCLCSRALYMHFRGILYKCNGKLMVVKGLVQTLGDLETLSFAFMGRR